MQKLINKMDDFIGIKCKATVKNKKIKTRATKNQYTFIGFRMLYEKKNEIRKTIMGTTSLESVRML